ncbi:MAG: DUF4349 domain-containing protein [Victivallales bacterium]|nr:DUF4349 domain-containing protein [Victivallales bacterium]
MKEFCSIKCLAIGAFAATIMSGCATVEVPPPEPVQDAETRLLHAQEERKTWLRLLQEAQGVTDAIKAREHLDRVQLEIEAIEAGRDFKDDAEAGFKSTKERTIIYGPVGIVLVAAKWIIDKSFIIYPWNWRAF